MLKDRGISTGTKSSQLSKADVEKLVPKLATRVMEFHVPENRDIH